MKNILTATLLILMAVFCSTTATAEGTPWAPNPDGMFSPTPVLARTCVAVRVPIEETQSLAGVRWYHNDALVAFPRVLVASGAADLPPLYEDGVEVGTAVSGPESGWTELTFAEPLASQSEALFVIFQLSPNEEGTEAGTGPGFGFVASKESRKVYLSADGDDWTSLVGGAQLLVDPVYTDREPGALALKSMRGAEGAPEEETPVVIARTELFAPYPNPFNPQATLSFALKETGHVSLEVFDIRGLLVRTIVDGTLTQGEHSYTWLGHDRSGQRVASGVYFVRLKAGDLEQIQRMTLVK